MVLSGKFPKDSQTMASLIPLLNCRAYDLEHVAAVTFAMADVSLILF
jgi:hypothetical protein